MKKCLMIFTALCLFLATGCGEKTKQALMNSAGLHSEYTVEDNAEAVYRRIVAKFMECAHSQEYFERNFSPETQYGEYYMHGASGSGYAFLTTIKQKNAKTHVAAYSSVTTGFFPAFM